MFTLNQSQIDIIRPLFDAQDYPGAYRKIAEFAEGQAGVDPAVILWLRGAAHVNENMSNAYSEYIRAYTANQFKLRFGDTVDPGQDINNASNIIAINVISTILDGDPAAPGGPVPPGHIPSIETIALQDALPAADEVFDGDLGGWAGNPLFLALGVNSPYGDNILHLNDPTRAADTYDALAMIQTLYQAGLVDDGLFALASTFVDDPSEVFTNITDNYGIIEVTFNFFKNAYGDDFGILDWIDFRTSSGLANLVLGLSQDDDDSIAGSLDRDIIHAGGGDDLITSSNSDDILDGGEGVDTADYSAAMKGFEFTLENKEGAAADFTATVQSPWFGGTDRLFNIEKIIATEGDDKFIVLIPLSDSPLQEIDFGKGIDTLDLSAILSPIDLVLNGEIVDGGPIVKGLEKIILSGNADGASINVDNSGGSETVATLIAAGLGIDTVDVTVTGGAETVIFGEEADDTINVISSQTDVFGGAGDDTITINGTEDGSPAAYGGSGNDTITATGGSADLYGGPGMDTLTGGSDVNAKYGLFGLSFSQSIETLIDAETQAPELLFVDDNEADTLIGGDGLDFFHVGDNDIIQNVDFASDKIILYPEDDLGTAPIVEYSYNPGASNTSLLPGNTTDVDGYFMISGNSIRWTWAFYHDENDSRFPNCYKDGPYCLDYGRVIAPIAGSVIGTVTNINGQTIIQIGVAESTNSIFGIEFSSNYTLSEVFFTFTIDGANPLSGLDATTMPLYDDSDPIGNAIHLGDYVQPIQITQNTDWDVWKIAIPEFLDSLSFGTIADLNPDVPDVPENSSDTSPAPEMNPIINGTALSDDIEGTTASESIYGNLGNDTITADFGDDDVYGGMRNDTLYGGSGDDNLYGGRGEDLLFGGTGNDTLEGGFNNDELRGDNGNDLINGNVGEDILRGGQGDDIIYGGAGDDDIQGNNQQDSLYGGTGDDVIDAGGGNDNLYGEDGIDILTGNSGADNLYGGIGDDTLSGNSGSDDLYGGDGNDLIYGGGGNDAMYGGAGADIFVFSAPIGVDRIYDFQNGTDKIDVTAMSAFSDIDDIIDDATQVGANVRIKLNTNNLIVIHDFDINDLDANDFIFGAASPPANTSSVGAILESLTETLSDYDNVTLYAEANERDWLDYGDLDHFEIP